MFFGVIEDVQAIVHKAGPYLNTIVKVVNDPALPQFIARVEAIDALDSGGSPSSSSTANADRSGVGLKNFLMPLDAYIYVRKNPWVPWALGGAFVLLVGGIGYGIGKRRAVR
jgi:hypothetical protein